MIRAHDTTSLDLEKPVKALFQNSVLCVVSFISILLLTRLQEIVRFAVLSGSFKKCLLFTLYQIPYIIPLSLPISALIASLILFKQMSLTSELTALRAGGVPIGHILAPLIFSGLFLGIINFYFTSEVTSHCRMRSKDLVYETTTSNPLVLMQKDKLLNLQGSYVSMNVTKNGEKASDIVFALHSEKDRPLSLVLADQIKIRHGLFEAQDVALIHTIDSKRPSDFDHLTHLKTKSIYSARASSLSEHMKSARQAPKPEYLPFRSMLVHAQTSANPKTLRRVHIEIARRFSLTLAALTFTLIGAIFGMEIGREAKKRTPFLRPFFSWICAHLLCPS